MADDSDLEQRYRFRFLTPAEAADRSGQFWFEVAMIRTFKDSFDALSSSDLLLSVATTQWRDRDAREVIHQLVDDLNETGLGFACTKDLVLKAGLVLLGRGDIRSEVGNFDRQTMREMEDAWDDINFALQLAAMTLSSFGFSATTLQADSVLIPVAHYLHLRNLNESYLSAAQHADDRQELRTWPLRSLIQSGVWGSGLDTLLSGLRSVLDAEARHGFPRAALEREMSRQGKSLRFDPAQIEDLLDTRYGTRAYPLLATLYPGVDVGGVFHMDHVFPKSRFTPARLRAAGVDADEIDSLMERANRLANLQLLGGAENADKRAKLPKAWMTQAYPDAEARAGYVTRNYLGQVPDEVTGFAEFYGQRRSRMRDRLVALLEAPPADAGRHRFSGRSRTMRCRPAGPRARAGASARTSPPRSQGCPMERS